MEPKGTRFIHIHSGSYLDPKQAEKVTKELVGKQGGRVVAKVSGQLTPELQEKIQEIIKSNGLPYLEKKAATPQQNPKSTAVTTPAAKEEEQRTGDKEFFDWVDRAVKDNRFGGDQGNDIKNASRDMSPQDFREWVDKNPILTSGNKKFIVAKFEKVLQSRVQPSPAPAASTVIPTLTSQKKVSYIPFYKTGPTEFLGNFALCSNGVTLDGHTFTNSEAAFQWKKFEESLNEPSGNVNPMVHYKGNQSLRDEVAKAFESCKDGEAAFQLKNFLEGNGGELPIGFQKGILTPGIFRGVYPKGWRDGGWQEGSRDKAMWDILQAKFSQNPDFQEKLASTGDAYLLEHNERVGRDTYWSDNGDGSGENMLGRMLMALRDSASHLADKSLVQELAADFGSNPQQFKIW